ncbi:hypothetical protein DID88_000415 [Monilinia fructigena]|uniref:HORMA domain-containing protein n=1 Tax=Monilinia fructigena TaxID=38457 RepID=A0A395IHZ6_9HELO|nr:hypothetical protein DID88_000415 [Monilinia fructigena]
MPPKLLKRPARTSAKSQAKLKTKPKGKVKATVQAPKIVQDIALSQEQSFELVKIGVNAAVSQFVFCRDFFPNKCYKTRIYNASDPDLTYETFINGKNVPKNLNLNEVGDEILSLNSVVRGTGHPGVEKLLDWLEFGVANAVNDKCLAKFQLSVYRKEVVPEQLVEALTINFTYKDTEGNSQVQVSISASISDRVGKVIDLGHAQNGLRDLISQVMNASMRLGGELTGRKVSMQLLYNQNARPKQEYRGFRAASTSEILPEDCGLSMGRMNNNFHGLAIKYYSAPVIDNPFHRGRALSAMIRGLNPTTPKAVICDNSRSLLRSSQASQSDETQRSTMQWLNDIGHGRGSNDMDTQPMTDNTNQRARFGKYTMSPELGDVGDKRIEEESDEEHEVRCECMNNDDRENLFAVPGIDLQGVSQNLNQPTPVARRLRQCHDGSTQGLQSEGSSTQTPTSWRSLHNETLRRSPRVPGQSTPQQSNKRAGDEILSNASKKPRDALAATSPFSLRSNSSN